MKRFKTRDKIAAALTTASLILAGCTKSLPQQFPDGVAEDIFEKSDLAKQEVTITLDEESFGSQSKGLFAIQALGQSTRLRVIRADGDARLTSLFKDLDVFGAPNASYKVRFDLSMKNVTAFKVVDGSMDGLPQLEQQIAVRKTDTQWWVPILQVDIETQGVVEQTKNDLGEKTRTLQLKETDADKATHIKMSTLASKRKIVGVQEADREEAKQIFLKDQINGTLLSKEDLLDKLKINVAESGLYKLNLEGQKLSLFRIQKLSEITQDLRDRIAESDKSGKQSNEIARCGEDILSKIAEPLRKDCVAVLWIETDQITYVNAQQKQIDREGSLSESVEFVNAVQPADAVFVRIAKDPSVRLVTRDDQLLRQDPRTTLNLDEVRDQEFFMRRTMKDSPSTFSFTFAGASGSLELVRFVPEDGRIRIVRADTLLGKDGATAVDKETLMAIPARYYRLVNFDEKGNPLAQPRAVTAHFSEEGALAQVDWTQNSIPTISSPLDFYEVEQCFSTMSDRQVSEVDQRLHKDGMLNFTLTSTYAGNRGSFDCAGISAAGYFDQVQKTFTFQERVSFKKHIVARGTVEEPTLSIPYEAQKVMGFGLFTYKKKRPNATGNTNVDGTEISLPAVFDIRNGKQIVYTLAGLPQGDDSKSLEIRTRITASTKRVIDDLNAAYRKALEGSPLARSEDVIVLKVEGVDADAGQLGDLDRNHIFYVAKGTDSGVIGLGGAHANPRSGLVESASVYLYGGNMMGMVESLRKLAKAKKDYDSKMAVKNLGVVEAAKSLKASGSGDESTSVALKTGTPESRGLNVARVQNGAHLAQMPSKLKTKGQDIARMSPGIVRADAQDVERAFQKLKGTDLLIARSLNDAVKANALNKPEQIRQIFHKHAHEDDASFVALGEGPMARMKAANICLMDRVSVETQIGALKGYDIDSKSDIEIMADIWTGTLAHEIGHNLGLRHNFEGSYDKANWKFSADENTTRDYSSIMDYLIDDHITYDGMGPSDVAGLRAAYAGLIELSPAILPAVTQSGDRSVIRSATGVSTEVVAGKYVRLEDYKKAIGIKSWIDLTPEATKALPLRPRLFCSDEEAGEKPTCNQFDSGSTPEEIVDNIIASYHERYSLSNFANDRLVFNDNSIDAYAGRILGMFMPIRQFLEETFYQASVVGAPGSVVQAHVEAVVKGLLFFNEVIRTPDASGLVNGDERFVKFTKNVPSAGDPKVIEKKQFTVERKWLKSVASGTEVDRLKTRGIEIDKVVATILLTNRSFGFPRYEKASINISYPDFEKLVIDSKSALELPTIALMNEVLSDKIEPQGFTPEGAIALPASLKSETSELMRIYAMLGSMIDLDAVGLTASDNLSTEFRILNNATTVPKGLPFVMQPGAINDLKYFAYPEAEVGSSMITKGFVIGKVRKLDATTAPLFKEWLKLTLEAANAAPGDATPNPATAATGSGSAPDAGGADPSQGDAAAAAPPKLTPLEAVTKKLNTQLAKLPQSAGPRDMETLGGLMLDVLDTAQQLDALSEVLPAKMVAIQVENLSNQLESMTKDSPTIGLALGTLSGEELKIDKLDAIVPSKVLEFQENTLFRNTQILSDLFLSSHPEYRR